MKKLSAILIAWGLVLVLAACAPKQALDTSQPPAPQPGASAQQPGDGSGSQAQGIVYTLYIGMDGKFEEYPTTYSGQPDEVGLVPPEAILEAMSELTGWNLDLADEITQGKGGMTVSFADTCAIFTGPPDPQKDAFRVFDASQLVSTILDSIKQTFQHYYVNVAAGGDPNSLDVYFCAAEGGIHLPELGVTIAMDRPYEGQSSFLTDDQR